MHVIALARRALPGAVTLIMASAVAVPATAVTTASWNGYRWARTGTLAIKTVSHLSTDWQRYFTPALRGWSAASQLNLVGSRGAITSACNPVFATIQVCNGSYGSNGWLGYTNVWLSGGFIVQATVRMNDTYFNQDRYDTRAFRVATLCHELGHTIGLAHNNAVRSDKNTGSCMDYSNDPDGGGRYGESNLAPGEVDFDGLDKIYAKLDSTQLSGTRLSTASDGFFIAGWDVHGEFQMLGVPEPGVWATLIAGFGLVGASQRRRRTMASA